MKFKATVSKRDGRTHRAGRITRNSGSSGRPPLGSLGSRGELRSDLQGGVRELVLRKDGYRPKTLSRATTSRARLSERIRELEAIQGSMTITLTDPPRGVRVKIMQTGGAVHYEGRTDLDVFPASVTLPKGLYNLSASAQNYETLELGPIEVDDGEQKTVPLKLARKR